MSKKYKELRKSLITLGLELPFEVILYIDDENSPVLFERGKVIDLEDIEKLKEYPEGTLIILKDDHEAHVFGNLIKS